MRNWSAEANLLSFLRKVKLPPEPSDCVTPAQQKSVSDFCVRCGRISSVHQPQNSSSAAVGNFKQHRAISLGDVLRFIKIEVRGKLHFSLRVARSFVQVHDLPVMNVLRLHGKVHAPNDLLVSPC